MDYTSTKNIRSEEMSQTDKKSTGVATEQQAKKMRESKFGTFNFDNIQREKVENVAITMIDKVMIHHGVVKFYNEYVKKKSEPIQKSINHDRFLDICDMAKLPDAVRAGYINRKANFLSQPDDLILAFSKLKPTELGEITYNEKKMFLSEKINKLMFQYHDLVLNLTPSKISLIYLAYIAPINLIELGLNPKLDKLSTLNNKQVDYFFNAMVKEAKG